MSVLIDTPVWPGPRGWLFAHMVSDHSYEELHAFARKLGAHPRAFDRDHYDIPEHLHARALELGAEHVSGRELVLRLRAAGLRRPVPRRPKVRAAPDRASEHPTGTASRAGDRSRVPNRSRAVEDGGQKGLRAEHVP